MTVLVTGAFGLVGSATVAHLAQQGRRVVATDLDIPANRQAAAELPSGVLVRYADLTDPTAVDALFADVVPTSVIHLAAVIAPHCYSRHALAQKVNVGGTANLVAAAARQADPPRFVLASSVAVYGPRNPHRLTDLLTADTPVAPYDIYGTHKVEAEALVRASQLDWAILRLGGVLTVALRLDLNPDFIFFEGLLPTDGRIQTVDVRDVARAFANATTADCVGETLLIGGDSSHRLTQGDIGPATAAAMGLVGGLPIGRRGDPDSDTKWFATDWMDTTRSQELLGFQRYSWSDMLIETAENAGWRRPLIRLAAPIAHQILTRRSAYHGVAGSYADPWGAITAKWGDPRPEGART
ncbi:NAD-dependent epimerase/dehydratase family protein [Mycolicibacterium tokaiense]|uniref:Nucleoside-diphosphate-sugar epimerase n=1 Tax=Mycolicibacterium tokaiense TaxID=39695 RepID=A0A378TIZ3_9MYCO|nr:NAD(P)-dependent oxidoreductase [Mycolicibacterium tokaiense]BBY84723.1 oxidoreductase [Mycolicibacterium tokaiense]STZ60771.1 nucleoside-diphosphate-sugar epimerase [Mycolicibacterium tokaiense]